MAAKEGKPSTSSFKKRRQENGRPRPWPSTLGRATASRDSALVKLLRKGTNTDLPKRGLGAVATGHKELLSAKRGSICRATCSDTIEESSSDEIVAQKKRPRSYRESRCCCSTHLQLHTCHLFHAYIPCVHVWCSRMTWHSVNCSCNLPTSRSLRPNSRSAHVVHWTISTQPVPLDVTQEEPPHGIPRPHSTDESEQDDLQRRQWF